MYKNIILLAVLYGYETWYLILRKNTVDWGCVRTGYWGEYLDL